MKCIPNEEIGNEKKRIFLKKVGGAYVFIHRLFLEHLAEKCLNQDLQDSQDLQDKIKIKVKTLSGWF